MSYLAADFAAGDPAAIRLCYEELLGRTVQTEAELVQLILDANELGRALEEDSAWRYNHMSCDTTSAEYREAWNFFLREIDPLCKPYEFKLAERIRKHPAFENLDRERYGVYARILGREAELFREENVALEAEIEEAASRYGEISAAMTVHLDGQELTLQRASLKLQEKDRATREEAWRAVADRRLADGVRLDELMDELLEMRHRVAKNAGFNNFRDYQHAKLKRFDYTPDDCIVFHRSIEHEVLPHIKVWQEDRRQRLGVDTLRPWDMSVDVYGDTPLRPFADSDDLIDGTIRVLNQLREGLGKTIVEMRRLGHLDLASRKGKAPGGYNNPLYVSGYPFIFMNAVGSHSDLTTMVHESGHAIHAVLTHEEPLCAYKDVPSEAAELASMSMELLSMAHWDVFYPDQQDLRRARRQQLERTLTVLPWVATIDAFQHWLYTHPGHSHEERHEAWLRIAGRFETGMQSWEGLESYAALQYQRQLHIYEVPFYYVEYAISQLGALQVWANSLRDKEKALDAYLAGLSLGYSKPLPEIYARCGIRFDFGEQTVAALSAEVAKAWQEL